MRKSLAGAGLIVIVALGFAAASIASGGGFHGVVAALTGTTGTVQTVTVSTTTPGGRRVAICHRTGSWKHPYRVIVVDQHAVWAHVRHGDHVGSCLGNEGAKRHGEHGHDAGVGPATTSTGSGHGDDDQGDSGHGNSGHGSDTHGASSHSSSHEH